MEKQKEKSPSLFQNGPQLHKVEAIVWDDDGKDIDVVAWYTSGENPFLAIEEEATERGIRYAGLRVVRFPGGLPFISDDGFKSQEVGESTSE